jgi:hypothetical protein
MLFKSCPGLPSILVTVFLHRYFLPLLSDNHKYRACSSEVQNYYVSGTGPAGLPMLLPGLTDETTGFLEMKVLVLDKTSNLGDGTSILGNGPPIFVV